MLVTNIEPQKQHPKRVNVYLDDTFAFGLHVDVLAAIRLHKGDHVSKEYINNILVKEEFNLAKQHSLRYLSYRRRSEKELRTKLLEKEFDPSTVDSVITHLQETGYINDTEFSKAFVHDTQLRKPSGRKLLQQKLRLKGIATDVITSILNEEVSEENEKTLALEEARKVIKRFTTSRKAVEQQKQQQRLAQHLARRGFSWAIIIPVIKEVFSAHASGGTS